MWCVAVGLHDAIDYSFLPVGHTKFSPDWCFGLLKQKLRNTQVNSLQDLVQVVESSASVNIAQLTGTQDGEVVVNTYNWQEGLSSIFKKVPDIKKFHHFQIRQTARGLPVLRVKTSNDSEYKEVQILKKNAEIPSNLPPLIIPKGLSLERQWYLFNKIREFCSEDTQDLVCPHPQDECAHSHSLPEANDLIQDSDSDPDEYQPPKPKRKTRTCQQCGKIGHNRRTCPELSQ